MKAYYETETFAEAMELMRKLDDGEYGINTTGVLLVQNVYKSDYNSNCIVIKYKRA